MQVYSHPAPAASNLDHLASAQPGTLKLSVLPPGKAYFSRFRLQIS